MAQHHHGNETHMEHDPERAHAHPYRADLLSVEEAVDRVLALVEPLAVSRTDANLRMTCAWTALQNFVGFECGVKTPPAERPPLEKAFGRCSQPIMLRVLLRQPNPLTKPSQLTGIRDLVRYFR